MALARTGMDGQQAMTGRDDGDDLERTAMTKTVVTMNGSWAGLPCRLGQESTP